MTFTFRMKRLLIVTLYYNICVKINEGLICKTCNTYISVCYLYDNVSDNFYFMSFNRMPRPKQCGCAMHEEWSGSHLHENIRIYNISVDRKYKVAHIAYMREQEWLSPRGNLLCTHCYERGSSKYVVQDGMNKKIKKDYTHEVDNIIKLINDGVLSVQELSKISTALGQSQRSLFQHEGEKFTGLYHSLGEIKTFKEETFLEGVNPIVFNFVTALTGQETISANKLNVLCVCIENLYKCVNYRFIGPTSFTINLLVYILSGSEKALNILSAHGCGGSYTTIKTWLKDNASEELHYSLDEDVITFFDNAQILGKNWRVKLDCSAIVSCITSIIHITSTHNASVQSMDHLSPAHWHNIHQNHSLIKHILETNAPKFDSFRDCFNTYKKDITTLFLEKVKYANMSATVTNKYDNLPCANTQPADIRMGEPCLVNPNSYSTVQDVMDHIVSHTKNDKCWTCIGCDGNPYLIACKLQQTVFKCNVCNLVWKGNPDTLCKHMETP